MFPGYPSPDALHEGVNCEVFACCNKFVQLKARCCRQLVVNLLPTTSSRRLPAGAVPSPQTLHDPIELRKIALVLVPWRYSIDTPQEGRKRESLACHHEFF